MNIEKQCSDIFSILEDNYAIVGLKMYSDPDHFS